MCGARSCATATYDPPLALDNDTMGVVLSVPLLLVACGWLVHTGRRYRRIAKHGRVTIGRVTGKVRSAWNSNKRSMYRSAVEGEMDGEPVRAQSREIFGSHETDALQSADVWVIHHPDYVNRASVLRRDGARVR